MAKIFFMLMSYSCLISSAIACDFNLFIGSNYLAPTTISQFERVNHCQLNQSFFNDNEEMLAKIAAGANGYNVIVATSYAVEQLARMGKIKPLNKARLVNLKYIDAHFLNQAYDLGNRYSVPYAYTPVFLAYNQEKLAKLGIVPNSWAVIFDARYLQKLKGHITVFDSARNVIAAALLYLGKDPNSTNQDELKQAYQLIAKASPYWAKFDSDSYYRGLLRGDIWLAMSYSIDIFKALAEVKLAQTQTKISIAAMLQREGNMYELDNLVIPRSANNDQLAYAFINQVLEPENASQLAAFTGASIPNQAGLRAVNPAVRQTPWIYPPQMNKMHVFKAYPPQLRLMISEMWTELKLNGNCRS